ncbi:MAG: AMP-binding protein [Bacteroidales bacterium]|nr:AMP-binding protein [Bacteroidales bacterium]
MIEYQYQDYIGLIEGAIKERWNCNALTDFKGQTYQYKDVARKIEKLHILFENAGVEPGDRIAVCGRNSVHWAVAFLATITYGAIVVPILHEFKPEQVHNIVNHAEARLLFASDYVCPTLDQEAMPTLEGIVYLPDFSLALSRSEKLTEARQHLNEFFGRKYPERFTKDDVHYRLQPDGEALAMINYTSGSTGKSKGVLIPYRALWSNYDFAVEVIGAHCPPGGRLVSMLPMAHMYGMAFEFLFEFIYGLHIHFLSRVPSPKVIMQAFAEVKPSIVIAVPLIIEKIIKKNVLPKVQTHSMQMLLRTPVIKGKILEKICGSIQNVFGGQFYEVIMGGAGLNPDVEEFLHKIGFNYTVGYGSTECAPIMSYEAWDKFAKGSCGKVAPRMEMKINSNDPYSVPGEILMRGANVMLGYYKNPEETAKTIDAEGWYHTGDIGVIDHEGNLYIRGRCKNMLLGSNGQNIYPEEIEDRLNSLLYVQESIVIQKGDKLYALIYPDWEAMEKAGLTHKDIQAQMEANLKELNGMINKYEQIMGYKLYKEEFEKTPKKSIKRFLYENEEV